MTTCKGCHFYNREYDEERRRYDDAPPIGREGRHFCIMFDEEGIEEGVWTEREPCSEFAKKRNR